MKLAQAAAQWLERGGNLAALQQIFGHASIETTQRYARLTDEAVMREAERIGRASSDQLWAHAREGTMARKFFFVCAGVLLLAAAYHLGAERAVAQSGIASGYGLDLGGNTGMAAIGRVIYYMGRDGVSKTLPPVPGTSPIVAMGGQGLPEWGSGMGGVLVVLENGDVFEIASGANSWAQHPGNLFGAATPVGQQTWGSLKARYR